jgi:hypothetical protein
MALTALAFTLIGACGLNDDEVYAQQVSENLDDTGVLVDSEPPIIEHTPVESPHHASASLAIMANMVDDTGILVAGIYFRTQTELEFQQRGMVTLGGEIWQGTINADELHTAGMHYYIEGVDLSGNVAVLPEEAPFEYFKFDLVD